MASDLSVTRRDSGRCDRYGGGAAGRDYYRCFGTQATDGHVFVFDPCFAGSAGTSAVLACPTDPTARQVVSFRATSVDTSTPGWTARRPWAMQLASGQVCTFVSAAWSGLGPYGCQPFSGSPTTADCREPQAGEPWWTASCQARLSDTAPFAPQTVRRVWF